jgi:hypothetical protein
MSRVFPSIGETTRRIGRIDAPDVPAGREARLLLVAAAVNVVLFAAVFSCLSIGYETNDDVRMTAIASGVMTGRPSQDLIVTSVLIGNVLKHLYQWTDRVNWYTLYLLAVHFATMTGLLYAFLRTRPARTSVILFGLLFAQFEVAQLLLLQFTSTAVLAGAVGVLLVIAASTPEAGRSRLAAAYGALLIVLSAMIRSDSLFYALALLAPFLAYEIAFGRRWPTYAQIGALVAVALMPVAYDAWYYSRDAGWRTFREYNALVRRLMDSPLVDYEPNTRFFFDRIGWSHNDWNMLRSLFDADPQLFSAARLKAIGDRFQGSSWGRTGARQYFEQRLAPWGVFRRMMYANMLLAVVLGRGRRLRLLLLGAGECLVVEILLVGFANYAKLAPRLILPAFDVATIIVFFEVLQTATEGRFLIWRQPASARIRGVAAVGAVAFCLCYALFCYRVASRHLLASESNAGGQHGFRALVGSIASRYVEPEPKVVFFDWAGAFPSQFTPPFDDSRTLRRCTLLLLDGWQINHPQFADRVARLGLGNLYRAAYENPNVHLFARPEYVPWIKRFALEHYQQRIFCARNDAYVVDTDFPSTAVGNFEFHVYQMAAGTPPPGVVAATPDIPTAARREDSPEKRAPHAARLASGL